MNRRQKIIVSVTGIFIVLLALVGLTYAYFLTKIKGNSNPKSISISTANLSLVYSDGNGKLEVGELLVPGNTVKFLDGSGNIVDKKTFTVTNDGNMTVRDYGIFFENYAVTYANDGYLPDDTPVNAGDITEFTRPQDFILTVTCVSKKVSDNSVSGTCGGYEGEMPNGNEFVFSNSIDPGIRHEYELSIYYDNPNANQSWDMNKTLEAKINLYSTGETVDIDGTTTDQNVDYVIVESEPKKTAVKGDGTFKVVGLEPGNHTITAYDSNNDELYSHSFKIEMGNEVAISGNTVTVTEYTRFIKLSFSSTGINILDTGALENKLYQKILANGATYTNSWERENGEYVWQKLYSDRDNCVETLDTNGVDVNICDAYYFNYKSKTTINDTTIKTLTTTVIDGTDASNAGLFQSEDDYGTSYYFRGPIINNYVSFAGRIWRIVRINGNNTVRLVLDDVYGNTTMFNVGEDLGNGNVGYMRPNYLIDASNSFYSNATYENTHANESSSDVKSIVDSFYDEELKGYSNLLADVIFCNDKTVKSGSGIKNETTTYMGGHRMGDYGSASSATLKCAEGVSNNYSRFTVDEQNINGISTNGDLDYPIGLLTADEVMLAGLDTYNRGYIQGVDKSWWTMTPAYVSSSVSGVYEVGPYEAVSQVYAVKINPYSLEHPSSNLFKYRTSGYSELGHDVYVRPVINIVDTANVLSGDGTKESPYRIG